jgi:predicted ATPase
MIQSITIENFKSFEKATLPLAPLTLLIGANASGKSNAVEALQLLSWLASGRRLGDILFAIRERELSIRGTFGDLTYRGPEISFECELSSPSPLLFAITFRVGEEGLRIVYESLSNRAIKTNVPLYEAQPSTSPYVLQVAYNNFSQGRKPLISCIDEQAVFTQLATPARFAANHRRSQKEIPAAATRLRRDLENMLFLDPDPRQMRGYSFLEEKKLHGDGANLSSVLYDLVKEKGRKEEILNFIRSLPEQNIRDVDFLEAPRGEVMVRLHETFSGPAVPREAALLSDGTLRVLAVAAALLSVQTDSLVVIEEIDNGVHPSRAELLLTNIERIARERALRVLLTTHNPALLDAIPPESIPHTIACYRDPAQGDSRLVRLEDLESYPELIAQGPVGRLVTKGILDRFLKSPDKRDRAEKVEQGLAWISEFRKRASGP